MNYSYPSLSIEHAKVCLQCLRENNPVNADQYVKSTGSGESFEFNDLGKLAKDLLELLGKIKGRSCDAQFEAKAAPILHAHLALPPEIAGNRDFWTWFTFIAAEGDFAHVVERRFKSSKKSGFLSDPVNFGIGSDSKLYEGLFARLWWRGHNFYEKAADDPYSTARRGYVDLWRSHIVRTNYGASRTMARALVEFLFPEEGQISGHDKTLVRELPKKVCAENSVTTFELLTLEECKDVLKDLAEIILAESGDE